MPVAKAGLELRSGLAIFQGFIVLAGVVINPGDSPRGKVGKGIELLAPPKLGQSLVRPADAL